MERNFENPARGGQTYVSPDLDVVELSIEGTICQASVTPDPSDWGEGAKDWFE